MKTDTTDLKPQFRKFLKSNRFLPLQDRNKTWNSLQVRHQSKCPPNAQIGQFRSSLKLKVPEKGGIYAYQNARNELLYIGKGVNIFNRVFSHYRESFGRFSGDRKGVWHRFFSQNSGRLRCFGDWSKTIGRESL